MSGGLFALVYGVSNAETHSWGDLTTIVFLAVGAALLAAFVAVEARVEHPLLPLRILRDRDRGGSYLATFMTSMGMFGVFLFLTYYLQQILGYSPIRTGLAFLPMSGGVVIAAMLGGSVLLPRLGRKLLVSLGMAAAAGGMVLLTQIAVGSSYLTHVAPGLVLLGIGIGVVFSAAFSGGTVGVEEEDSGVASATVNTALLSTLYASAVSGYISDHHASHALAAAAQVHGYTTAFWWSAAILGAGSVISALLFRPGTPAPETSAEPMAAL